MYVCLHLYEIFIRLMYMYILSSKANSSVHAVMSLVVITITFSYCHWHVNFPEDKFSTKVRDRWLQELFDGADKNGDGTLDLKEVVQMMKSLNVGVSKKAIKKMFKVS